jgi:hypothetical protein
VRNSRVTGTEVKCFNVIAGGEGPRLYAFLQIFRVLQNPHLIHTTPRVASVTVTLNSGIILNSDRKIVDRGKIDTSYKHIGDR